MLLKQNILKALNFRIRASNLFNVLLTHLTLNPTNYT